MVFPQVDTIIVQERASRFNGRNRVATPVRAGAEFPP
jgi:hypothetical protein